VSIPTIYHTWASVITKRASEYILHIYTVTLLIWIFVFVGIIISQEHGVVCISDGDLAAFTIIKS